MLSPVSVNDPITREICADWDAVDSLAHVRDRFAISEPLYLDGNSLGVLPKNVPPRLAQTVENEWGRGLIRSWNQADWIRLPQTIGDAIAPLLGAGLEDVVVADSTSINLFKLLASAVRLRPGRTRVLTEESNFPSDVYMMEGLADISQTALRIDAVPGEELLSAIDDSTAVVCVTHVNYRTGRMHDLVEITRAAHDAGALMLWDLAHSAGAMPLDLVASNADMAVGCGYKFFNGGPGAPSFLYVHPRLQSEVRHPLQGWLGHAAPFDFEPTYRPADGINRHICGTPPVLSMVALAGALEAFAQLDMQAVRAKANRMAELIIHRFDSVLAHHGFELVTPRKASERGSQISFSHPDAYAICQALIEHGVIGDYREPNLLRFGLTPLYTRFVDIWDAMEILERVMESRIFEEPRFNERAYVT